MEPKQKQSFTAFKTPKRPQRARTLSSTSSCSISSTQTNPIIDEIPCIGPKQYIKSFSTRKQLKSSYKFKQSNNKSNQSNIINPSISSMQVEMDSIPENDINANNCRPPRPQRPPRASSSKQSQTPVAPRIPRPSSNNINNLRPQSIQTTKPKRHTSRLALPIIDYQSNIDVNNKTKQGHSRVKPKSQHTSHSSHSSHRSHRSHRLHHQKRSKFKRFGKKLLKNRKLSFVDVDDEKEEERIRMETLIKYRHELDYAFEWIGLILTICMCTCKDNINLQSISLEMGLDISILHHFIYSDKFNPYICNPTNYKKAINWLHSKGIGVSCYLLNAAGIDYFNPLSSDFNTCQTNGSNECSDVNNLDKRNESKLNINVKENKMESMESDNKEQEDSKITAAINNLNCLELINWIKYFLLNRQSKRLKIVAAEIGIDKELLIDIVKGTINIDIIKDKDIKKIKEWMIIRRKLQKIKNNYNKLEKSEWVKNVLNNDVNSIRLKEIKQEWERRQWHSYVGPGVPVFAVDEEHDGESYRAIILAARMIKCNQDGNQNDNENGKQNDKQNEQDKDKQKEKEKEKENENVDIEVFVHWRTYSNTWNRWIKFNHEFIKLDDTYNYDINDNFKEDRECIRELMMFKNITYESIANEIGWNPNELKQWNDNVNKNLPLKYQLKIEKFIKYKSILYGLHLKLDKAWDASKITSNSRFSNDLDNSFSIMSNCSEIDDDYMNDDDMNDDMNDSDYVETPTNTKCKLKTKNIKNTINWI